MAGEVQRGDNGFRERWWIATLPLIKEDVWVPYNHLENIFVNSIWKVDVLRLFGSFQ